MYLKYSYESRRTQERKSEDWRAERERRTIFAALVPSSPVWMWGFVFLLLALSFASFASLNQYNELYLYLTMVTIDWDGQDDWHHYTHKGCNSPRRCPSRRKKELLRLFSSHDLLEDEMYRDIFELNLSPYLEAEYRSLYASRWKRRERERKSLIHRRSIDDIQLNTIEDWPNPYLDFDLWQFSHVRSLHCFLARSDVDI